MNNISIISYLILGTAILYAFFYPKFGEVKILLSQKKEHINSLETIKNIETKKNELLRQYNNISTEDKNRISTILPDSLDLIRLISQIDSVASRHGISVSDVSSSNKSDSVGSSINTAKPLRDFQSATIGFSFDSSYDKFNDFMADLEKSLRILDIRSLKLETKDKGLFSYDVEFETYWLEKIDISSANSFSTGTVGAPGMGVPSPGDIGPQGAMPQPNMKSPASIPNEN